ncbi:hypothetical protein [Variovorax sp. LG9.2]|uniref:hypothetical protein n=1 Tax=Variovorax sp. LG9.2 TaxID=3048626 RepID=UPI002B23CFEA|nr:hypothetical protein [Variovorax sp. LG9.2]MEB0055957.1 hypothetical protein [Variovorax sp. LG9.2]
MTPVRTLVALSAAVLASACASPGSVNAPPPSSNVADTGAAASMTPMEPRMKAMQEMHQKMMNAKTPEERSALMADHMKAMQGGMSMMKGMSAMDGKGSMEGMGAMADTKGMPADMAKHHKTMEQRMTTMQMMMELMMDRMPPASMKQ